MSSRHEGVSCDACLKGNFRGRRYKCLICYDYDLCAACYEAGATNTRHTTDHPMQCILTRADYEVYYGGEALTSLEMPQSYTCPYCARMGFTETTLQEHVSADHADTSFEVVCPLCAAMPGGEPNLMTDDFAGHLTLEHRSGSRDLISFLDEGIGTRHGVRRMPHGGHSGTHIGRGAATLRPRRSNMHFRSEDPWINWLNELPPLEEELPPYTRRGDGHLVMSGLSCGNRRTLPQGRTSLRPHNPSVHEGTFLEASNHSSGGLSSLSPSSRESVDPIAELLSQLSGVRRSGSNAGNSPSQLQQLQMQLQLERQQVNVARQQLERFPRRQTSVSQASGREQHASSTSSTSTLMLNSSPVLVQPANNSSNATSPSSQFLLASLLEELSLQTTPESTRQDRSQFVQELVLSTAAYALKTDEEGTKEPPDPALATFKAKLMELANEAEEQAPDSSSSSNRHSSGILRGRARSDSLNAKRRAEANRLSENNSKGSPKKDGQA